MDRSRILAAFYVRFDNKIGPKLCAVSGDSELYPESLPESNRLDKLTMEEVLEDLGDYLIPKPDCCGKILSIEAAGFTVMGQPMLIQGNQYERYNFLYNVAFLFDADAECQVYAPLVTKLARYFETLEVESGFLSDEAQNLSQVQSILAQVVEGINLNGHVEIPVNESNVIYLKVLMPRPDLPIVHSHEVPVRVRDLDEIYNEDWDLTLYQIIPFIDGHTYVRRIALEADVDLSVVKECLQHLIYFGHIKMVDIFQYSNTYMVTERITELAGNLRLQEQCKQYVTVRGKDPPFTEIFKLYCSMRPGLKLNAVCNQFNTRELGIDDRRLITFGVINGFLRRIHGYPHCLGDAKLEAGTDKKYAQFLPLLDGSRCFDEICCELSKATNEVDDIMRRLQTLGRKFHIITK